MAFSGFKKEDHDRSPPTYWQMPKYRRATNEPSPSILVVLGQSRACVLGDRTPLQLKRHPLDSTGNVNASSYRRRTMTREARSYFLANDFYDCCNFLLLDDLRSLIGR